MKDRILWFNLFLFISIKIILFDLIDLIRCSVHNHDYYTIIKAFKMDEKVATY